MGCLRSPNPAAVTAIRATPKRSITMQVTYLAACHGQCLCVSLCDVVGVWVCGCVCRCVGMFGCGCLGVCMSQVQPAHTLTFRSFVCHELTYSTKPLRLYADLSQPDTRLATMTCTSRAVLCRRTHAITVTLSGSINVGLTSTMSLPDRLIHASAQVATHNRSKHV